MERTDVISFLSKDFWRYINQGGMHPGELSAAQISGVPSSHTNINSTEKEYIETMSKAERARYLAITILIAIKDCSDFEYRGKHKSILDAYYVQNLDNRSTAIKVNMSDAQYKRAKKEALQEFIQRYNFWRDYRQCPELPEIYYPQKPKKLPKSTQKATKINPKTSHY